MRRKLTDQERSTAWQVAREVSDMALTPFDRRAEVRRRLKAAGWEEWLTRIIVAVILELIRQQFTSGEPLPQSMPTDFLDSTEVHDAKTSD